MKMITVQGCDFSTEDTPAIAVCEKCGNGFSEGYGSILELKLHQRGDVPRSRKLFPRCLNCVPTVEEESELVAQMDVELSGLVAKRIKGKV